MGPLFESHPRPLLKSGLQPLGRYGTHQETIGMRHEQMYTLSDTRLEWLGEESLFESNSNKRLGDQYGATIRVTSWLKSGLQLLGRYYTHQESIIGDLNRCIFHLTQDWNGLGRGHYSSSI